MMQLLGVSKLYGTHSLRATITRYALCLLEIKPGGRIAFFEDEGRAFIENA